MLPLAEVRCKSRGQVSAFLSTRDTFHNTYGHFIHCWNKNIDYFSFKVWICELIFSWNYKNKTHKVQIRAVRKNDHLTNYRPAVSLQVLFLRVISCVSHWEALLSCFGASYYRAANVASCGCAGWGDTKVKTEYSSLNVLMLWWINT